MTPVSIVLLAFGLALIAVGGLRHLMAARVCLTCAVEEVRARPVEPAQLDPGELVLLTWLDEQLLAVGFRPLGFGTVNSPITYFEGRTPVRVFLNERIPAYALVRYRGNPEPGYWVEAEISTQLSSGEEWVTANTGSGSALLPLPAWLRIEEYPGSPVAALVARHTDRVAAIAQDRLVAHDSLERALEMLARDWGSVRRVLRERKWTVASADPTLDRFTLRGAFALAHEAINRNKQAKPVLSPLSTVSEAPPQPPPPDALLIEADLQSMLHTAEHPRTAPGTPWPVVSLLVAGAVLSFAVMTLVFDPIYAVLVLIALALHEGGHALAMRAVGYRNVKIFFIPLFGAITVGQPVKATVRGRIAVLLAGPVPGMWLAVLLFAITQHLGSVNHLGAMAFVLLFLNGLNLLPTTPLDGGRVFEVLTRPESIWRPVFHGFSAIGLLALCFYLQDMVLMVFGLGWMLLLPQQWQRYKLRRAVAAVIQDRSDFRAVARTTLEVISKPPYGKFRSSTRQATARAMASVFRESEVTGSDRLWGAIAYVTSWAPVAIALLLMHKR